MRQRLAALVLIAAGLTLVGVTLQQNLPAAGTPFAQLVERFGPPMSQPGRAQLHTDLTIVRAGSEGLAEEALPALADATGQTPAQLADQLGTQYPAVATGLQELPGILDRFDGFAALLDSQAADFRKVDAIPISGVTPRTVPPAMIAVGALLALLGVGLLLRPGRRALPATATGLSLAVLVLALAATLPAKADASGRLKTALDPALAPSAVTAVQQDLATVAGMAAQLQNELLPDTAKALGTTPAALAGTLAAASPAVGTLLTDLPQVQERFAGLAALLQANVGTWQKATRPDLSIAVRTLLAVSAVGLLAGLAALTGLAAAAGRREDELTDDELTGAVAPATTAPAGAIPAQNTPVDAPKEVDA